MDKIDIYFQKGDLHHHLYLIEGSLNAPADLIFEYFQEKHSLEKNSNNFFHKNYEKFLVDDARMMNEFVNRRNAKNAKHVFIISATSITEEAQNAILKSVEEPVEGTYFFFIMPTLNNILDTIKSRAYILDANHLDESDFKLAEKIINTNFAKRQEMIKDFAKKHENGVIRREYLIEILKSVIKYLRSEKHNYKDIERLQEVYELVQKPDVGLKSMFEAILFLTPYKK